MSKILITGNGFDLFHDLPTKYGHFMDVMKTIEEFDSNQEPTFENLFGSYFKNNSYNEYNNLIQDNALLDISFSKEKIRQMSLIKDNIWYQYFNKVNQVQTWIDFENEISYSLKITSKIITSFDNNSLDFLKIKEHKGYQILTYLKIIEVLDGSKFVIEDRYLNEINGKVNSNELFEYLILELKNFTKTFNIYLDEIVVKIMPFIKKKMIPFDKIDSIYTFNYTPTIENVYNYKGSINYLHGKVSSKDEDYNLVLGIDELENEVKQAKAFFFLKNHQRILMGNKAPFITEISPNKSPYDKPTTYYLIGHSLDKSDKNYISRLFNSLKNDKTGKCQIVIFYYNENDYRSKLNNLFSFIDNELLLSYFEKERLKFLELNEEVIKKEFEIEKKGAEIII